MSKTTAKALDDLFSFCASRPLSRSLLMEWRAGMESLSPSTINVRLSAVRKMIGLLIGWYNRHRPHATLAGKTPDEVYFHLFPANLRPRLEPRARWPRGSPCAQPQVLVAGKPGAKFALEIERQDPQMHLPVVRLRRAA